MVGFQFIRFGLVGALVAGIHLALVFFLTNSIGVWYLYSTIISYTIATSINFFLQKFYVMRHMDTTKTHIQFVKYVLLALLCLGLNTVGMYILVEWVHIPYLYAQVVVIGLVAIFTFSVSRSYIFR